MDVYVMTERIEELKGPTAGSVRHAHLHFRFHRFPWPGSCSHPANNILNMGNWISDTLTTGAVATAATTAAVTLLGRIENGSAVGPLNAVSHMLWGREATTNEQVDARHTLAGAGLNAAAVTGWAGLHELLLQRDRKPSLKRAVLAGVATAAAAYITDYHVVPKRFTPGFETRLSQRSLFGVYAVLALSLAAGSLSRHR